MTRRALLGLLAAAAIDPERLLWVPGRKLISIPQPARTVDVMGITWFDQALRIATAYFDALRTDPRAARHSRIGSDLLNLRYESPVDPLALSYLEIARLHRDARATT